MLAPTVFEPGVFAYLALMDGNHAEARELFARQDVITMARRFIDVAEPVYVMVGPGPTYWHDDRAKWSPSVIGASTYTLAETREVFDLSGSLYRWEML